MVEHPIDDAVIVLISALVGGLGSFLVTRWSFSHDARNKNYVHADALYVTILQLYLSYPAYAVSSKTLAYKASFEPGECERYEAFACLVHNFLETLFDLFHRARADDIDKQWVRIFDHHAKLHLAWALDNPNSFEPEYVAFLRRRHPPEGGRGAEDRTTAGAAG